MNGTGEGNGGATRYPFDYDELDKGDIISAETLEELTGYERGTQDYNLQLMVLQNQIMDEMEVRDRPMTVRIHKGGLELLTDAQASVYNHGRGESGLRQMKGAVKRLGWTDMMKLTDEERKNHDRTVLIQSRMLQGAMKGRKESFRQLEHKRPAPKQEQIEDKPGG